MINRSPRMPLVRQVTSALLLVMAIIGCWSVAHAHAKLVRSQPAANASLKQAPKVMELWFSEELEAEFSTIVVTDPNGKRLDKNDVSLAEGNKKMQISLEDLPPGTYTVDWKALSTDQHTMKGKFAFTVVASAESPAQAPQPQGAITNVRPSPAPPQPSMTSQPNESIQESSSSWTQSLVRWFQYLSMMTLFGGFAFYLTVLAPVLRQVPTSAGTARDKAAKFSERRTLLLSWMSVILIFLTSVIALMQQASAVFDKPLTEALSLSLLNQVLTKTGFGGAWFLQIIATAAFPVLLVLLNFRTKRQKNEGGNALWWIGLVAGLVLLVAPSWTGHAAAAKDFRLAIVTDWLHIVAGGIWVGGLFHLGLTALPALSRLGSQVRTPVLGQLIRRFTRIAIPSVALLVLAGLYNTWVHVESFQAFWFTAYGRTLLIKLVLVGIMLALGGLNNFHFGKHAARLTQTGVGGSEANMKIARGFKRSVLVEAVIGVAVLLVTAILVFLTPPRVHPPMTASQPTIIQQVR
jgi:copper transport protein